MTLTPRGASDVPDDVTERTRRDWRYAHICSSGASWKEAADVLSGDSAVALARTRASLELGGRGRAGTWLENESLLAIRRVTEDLAKLTTRSAALEAEKAELTLQVHELKGILGTYREVAAIRAEAAAIMNSVGLGESASSPSPAERTE